MLGYKMIKGKTLGLRAVEINDLEYLKNWRNKYILQS